MSLFSAVLSLAAAPVVNYDSNTCSIEALPEAYHMTRNMIKLSTMQILMQLPNEVDLKQVVYNL